MTNLRVILEEESQSLESPMRGNLHVGFGRGCDPFSRNLVLTKGMRGKGRGGLCNLMDVWVRTVVQFPPQRCTGDGSTLRQSRDTRLSGARQGCKADGP